MTLEDESALDDELLVTVDGERFQIVYDASQPGAYHYTWLSGPNPGYGFTGRHSSHQRRPVAEHEPSIRAFLDMIDPATGYIEDDPDDETDD